MTACIHSISRHASLDTDHEVIQDIDEQYGILAVLPE